MNKKVLGIIPARGGSKGIPRKNVKLLLGKPLIAYTIEAAKESHFLDRFILSTEDEEIAAIARSFGCEVPFLRPKRLATDITLSIEVVQHALQWVKEQDGNEYEYVMILQPTSPLRTAEDIDGALSKMYETNADSVMSMVELEDFSLQKLKIIEEGLIKPLIEEEGPLPSPRQKLEKVYKRNCAIYLSKTYLVKKGDLFGNISRAYVMPFERSIDINRPIDFELAEFFLLQCQLNKNAVSDT